jgi:DNA polymerase-3 subunit alpha
MMFATLDDLEGSLELIVFENVMADHEPLLGVDQVVLVRGRVDHKDSSTTCLIVQGVERFAPTADEVERARRASTGIAPPPLRVCLDAGRLPASVIDDVKHVLETFPGDAEVVLEMRTSAGSRTLKLGASYRVAPGASLRAELSALLGEAVLSAG